LNCWGPNPYGQGCSRHYSGAQPVCGPEFRNGAIEPACGRPETGRPVVAVVGEPGVVNPAFSRIHSFQSTRSWLILEAASFLMQGNHLLPVIELLNDISGSRLLHPERSKKGNREATDPRPALRTGDSGVLSLLDVLAHSSYQNQDPLQQGSGLSIDETCLVCVKVKIQPPCYWFLRTFTGGWETQSVLIVIEPPKTRILAVNYRRIPARWANKTYTNR